MATVVVFSVLAAGLVPGVGPFPSGGSLAPDTTAAEAVLMAQGIAAGAPGRAMEPSGGQRMGVHDPGVFR